MKKINPSPYLGLPCKWAKEEPKKKTRKKKEKKNVYKVTLPEDVNPNIESD